MDRNLEDDMEEEMVLDLVPVRRRRVKLRVRRVRKGVLPLSYGEKVEKQEMKGRERKRGWFDTIWLRLQILSDRVVFFRYRNVPDPKNRYFCTWAGISFGGSKQGACFDCWNSRIARTALYRHRSHCIVRNCIKF